jgi:hypothetical protein
MNVLNGTEVTFMFNGEKVGSTQTIDSSVEYINSPEKQIKNGENLSLLSVSRGISITCENVQISPEFTNMFFPKNKKYKVVGTGYKYPRGNKLPKKKRISKKWIRKYQHEFVLNDCIII